MRKPREIPPSPDQETLKTWVQQRMFYINALVLQAGIQTAVCRLASTLNLPIDFVNS